MTETNRIEYKKELTDSIEKEVVHNDYSNEVPPKFEIFADRLEITSTGGLVQGLSQDEFFEGYSIPRNKKIMRIYKDLDMVEYLGSGLPRILKAYSRECFKFSENFLRMSFQASSPVYFNEGGTIKNSGGIIDKIELNERQKEIIDLIKKNKNISSREMSQELNINHSAVQKHLNKLKNAGIITRVGGTRGHWEINL